MDDVGIGYRRSGDPQPSPCIRFVRLVVGARLAQPDWVQERDTPGRITLIHRGRSTELIEPRLWETKEAPAAIPAVAWGILRRANVQTFLLARRAHG